jgi:hypothetical protein
MSRIAVQLRREATRSASSDAVSSPFESTSSTASDVVDNKFLLPEFKYLPRIEQDTTRGLVQSAQPMGRARRIGPPCPVCHELTDVHPWGKPGYWVCGRRLEDGQICSKVFAPRVQPVRCPNEKTKKHKQWLPLMLYELHFGVWGYACPICYKFYTLDEKTEELVKVKYNK